MPRPFNPLIIAPFGGENDTLPSVSIPDQEGALVKNLYLVNGGLERRLGSTLANTATGDTLPITGLMWCRLPATSPVERVVGVHGGSLLDYYGGGIVGAPVALAGGANRLSLTTPVDMAVIDNKLYAADGSNAMVRYNGTSVAKAGSPAPATAPAFSAFVGAGVLTGNVQYVVVYLDADGHESEASPASAALSPSGQNVTLTLPNDTDSDRSGKNVYRLGVASTVYKLVNPAPLSASATSYTDSVADASLGLQLVTGNALFPSCPHLWEHDNRLFGCGNALLPKTLFISNEFQPWYCPSSPNVSDATQGLRLQVQGRNAVIIGGVSHGGYCFLFTDEGGYVLQGTSQDDYRIERFTTHGCVSHRTIRTLRNWLFWVGPDGVYRYDGTNVQRIDYPIRQFFTGLRAAQLSTAAGWIYDDRYYLSFPSDGLTPGAAAGTPGGGIAAVNPNTLSGWQVIADARSIVGKVDGDNLTAWNDTSGNARNATGVAKYKVVGGVPWVDFFHPGTNTTMNFPLGGTPISCTSGFTLYAILFQEGLNAAQGGTPGLQDQVLAECPAVNGFTVYTQRFQSSVLASTNSSQEFTSNTAVDMVNPTSITLPFASGFVRVVTVIAYPPIDTGTVILFVDGVPVASQTGWHISPSDSLSALGFLVGVDADSSGRQLQARVGWIGWASRADSNTTRLGVEKYLHSVWG